jgi:hypothetical protein
MTTDALIADLATARDDLLRLLDGVSPESMTTSGLLGEWSGRELIAHLGYWAGRAAEAVHQVDLGVIEEGEEEEAGIDAVNDTVARIARATDLATVRRREAASVEALAERLRTLDPGLLATILPDGSTLEETVRVDGPEHYRGHADELRAVLGARPHA